jgi:hypothetical protein
MTTQDYLDIITSEYANQPDFSVVISFNVATSVQVQALLQSMIPLFDLSTPPVGNQLDILGQWVGVSRNITIPISGVYFTWDGAANVGWDFGSWQPGDAPTDVTSLPDDAYLQLILAKIAANIWDGTTEGAYKIFNALFTGFTLLIQDYQNMSYAVIIIGYPISSLTLALITGGYIPLRPEGVEITQYYIASAAGPVFGWDIETSSISGWDTGNWATQLAPT